MNPCARFALWALLGAASPGSAQTPGASIITVEQAVSRTLASHPALRVAEARLEAANARVDQSKSDRLPVVRASETGARSNNPVFVFGSLLEQSRFGAANFALPALNGPPALQNFRAALDTSVTLYNGGQTASRIEQAEAAARGSRENRNATEQALRFQAIRAYYRLVLARRSVEVARAATTSAEADAALAGNRRDAGVAVDSDVLAAEVQLAEFRRRQIDAEGESALAQSELNLLMGLPSGEPLQLPEAAGFREFPAPSEDSLLQTAIAKRADYAAAQTARQAAQQTVKERSGERLPRVDAFARAGVSGRHPFSGSSDYTVGATVSISVFDPGRNARIAESHQAEMAAAAQAEQTALQIRSEVLQARQHWLTAAEQLRVSRAGAGQAAEALRITRDRYQAGLETITALLRAQTDVARARTNVIASEHAYMVGYAAVLAATGMLTDAAPFTEQ